MTKEPKTRKHSQIYHEIKNTHGTYLVPVSSVLIYEMDFREIEEITNESLEQEKALDHKYKTLILESSSEIETVKIAENYIDLDVNNLTYVRWYDIVHKGLVNDDSYTAFENKHGVFSYKMVKRLNFKFLKKEDLSRKVLEHAKHDVSAKEWVIDMGEIIGDEEHELLLARVGDVQEKISPFMSHFQQKNEGKRTDKVRFQDKTLAKQARAKAQATAQHNWNEARIRYAYVSQLNKRFDEILNKSQKIVKDKEEWLAKIEETSNLDTKFYLELVQSFYQSKEREIRDKYEKNEYVTWDYVLDWYEYGKKFTPEDDPFKNLIKLENELIKLEYEAEKKQIRKAKRDHMKARLQTIGEATATVVVGTPAVIAAGGVLITLGVVGGIVGAFFSTAQPV